MPRPKGSKNGLRTLVPVTCTRCGKIVYRKPSDAAKSKYCSKECVKIFHPSAKCRACSKEYIPGPATRGAYCSMECYIQGVSNGVEKLCPQCGKTFVIRKSHADRRTFCSIECKRMAESAAWVTVTCAGCGNEFKVPQARKNISRYCSRECRNKSNRVRIICAYCGNEKTIPRYRVIHDNTRCCSNRCATLLRMQEGFLPGYIAEKRRTKYRTDIEQLAEEVLVNLGITYLFEFKIGRYSVDFAIPHLGIILECDGWQHHTPEGIQRDKHRDQALADDGWQVIHVDGYALRKNALLAVSQALNTAI